jgi:putative transcriptional regulator
VPQPGESLRDRLVVAAPSLLDPNFREAVVLLLEHTEDGAFGLILNRATEMPVREPLGDWEGLAAAPAVVFVGGPVEPDGVLGLARLAPHLDPAGWDTQLGGHPLVDFHADPSDVEGEVAAVRAFAGHSGWGGGQLEEEIAAGSWFVLDREDGDVFTPEPDTLWRRVLERQGGLYSTVTPDPSAN